MKLLTMVLIVAFGLMCFEFGRQWQTAKDKIVINRAIENEMQANGLEDECKATLQQGQTNISGVAGSVTVTK